MRTVMRIFVCVHSHSKELGACEDKAIKVQPRGLFLLKRDQGPRGLFLLKRDQGDEDKAIKVQPIAIGVSFLHSQFSIDDLVLEVSSTRSVEKRPRRLRLDIEIK